MKTTIAMIFIALFAVGCSNTSSQTPVESALDHVDTEEEAEVAEESEASDEEILRLADGYNGHETLHASFTNLELSDDAAGEEQALTSDDETDEGQDLIESDLDESVSRLVGESWADETNGRVYTAVKDLGNFGDRDIVPLAHYRNGARNVVIFWPALTSDGALAGSAVYGMCVEEQGDGSFESCSQPWRVNEVTASSSALAGAMGGTGYELVSSQTGGALDQVGSRIVELGNTFVQAVSEGEREVAFQAAQEFMQLLPVEDRAFDNTLAQLLVTAARDGRDFQLVKTETGDLLAAISFRMQGNYHEVTAMHLTAQQVSGSNEWRVVDFW